MYPAMRDNNYWEEKERKYKAKIESIMSRSQIRWLNRNGFWQQFDNEYLVKGRFLAKNIEFPIKLEQIRARILDIHPVFSPFEEDFPGPVERWYGESNGHLFLLTYYYRTPPFTIVCMEDNSDAEREILDSLKTFKDLNPYT
jgi:hypothetical protein